MNQKTLRKLSSLCAIPLNPREQERMVDDLSSILKFVDQLHSVPTAGVEPMIYPTSKVATADVINSDIPEQEFPGPHDSAQHVEHFYLIPKVIKP